MPPTTAHFNGGVNLADAETVMREIAARVPSGVSRVPDGETGDRQNWIFFQLQRFWQTPGVERTPEGPRPPFVSGSSGPPRTPIDAHHLRTTSTQLRPCAAENAAGRLDPQIRSGSTCDRLPPRASDLHLPPTPASHLMQV
jgi:hypothetical protein